MYDYDMKVSCNSAIEAGLQMLIITHGRAPLHLFDNSPEKLLPSQKNKYWEHICIYKYVIYLVKVRSITGGETLAFLEFEIKIYCSWKIAGIKSMTLKCFVLPPKYFFSFICWVRLNLFGVKKFPDFWHLLMMDKRSYTVYHKFPKHLHFFCEGQRFALALKEIKQLRSGWEWSSHKIGCIFAFVQANL